MTWKLGAHVNVGAYSQHGALGHTASVVRWGWPKPSPPSPLERQPWRPSSLGFAPILQQQDRTVGVVCQGVGKKLLSVMTSNNLTAYINKLATGGEYVTHLSLLLTCKGVLNPAPLYDLRPGFPTTLSEELL
jgi:hypothetical protein